MPDTAGPHVVLIGGFLTEAAHYRAMRLRLLDLGAAAVTIAPIHLPDWAVMGFAGMGPLLLRGARAMREARRASGAPIVVVGHSMGGIIARLAMAPAPLDGRWAGVADDVACLVTLGTPHRFTPELPWRHAGQRAAEHLERVSPGAFFAPTTGYLSVGSSLVRPARRPAASSAVALLNRVLEAFVGETPGTSGDGLVGSDLARLEGARHIGFLDVVHGPFYGPWYGDAAVIERWWPAAVEEWRSALSARAARAGSPGLQGPVRHASGSPRERFARPVFRHASVSRGETSDRETTVPAVLGAPGRASRRNRQSFVPLGETSARTGAPKAQRQR